MELSPETLEVCYENGAFPMADGRGEVSLYRSDPRAVLELDALRVSKSLGRVIRTP
jgi:leucyl/phenylalanyl-tRNA--protein transferase